MKRGTLATPVEIRQQGFAALCDRLGVAGALAYLQDLQTGRGDYTSERRRLLANQTVDAIVARVQRRSTGRKRSSA